MQGRGWYLLLYLTGVLSRAPEHYSCDRSTPSGGLDRSPSCPHVPHAKKTDLAPLTLPAETEAPLVRAGSEALQDKMTGLAFSTLAQKSGTAAPLEPSWTEAPLSPGKPISKTAQRQVSVLKNQTDTCCVVLQTVTLYHIVSYV